jgi:hypothetical protein
MTEIKRLLEEIAIKEFAVYCADKNIWLMDSDHEIVLFSAMIKEYLDSKENKEQAK